MSIGQSIMHEDGGQKLREFSRWLVLSICLILGMSLCAQAYSHGPGAWLDGQRIAAQAEAHGHSHSPVGHNATDHDHQNAEVVVPEYSHLAGRFSPPDAPALADKVPDDIAGDGLRRPPRSVAV